jgi:hypothetical protein
MTDLHGKQRLAQSELVLLGIHLNDHLAGATAGTDLARRAAGSFRGTPSGPVLERLASEIAEDRRALVDIMRSLGVPIRHYKLYAAWAAEKVGRLKLNGRVLGRSPLSNVVELESLRIGVQGKMAGWRVLRALANPYAGLAAQRLDELIERARRQAETLDELHLEAAADSFGAT